jgi:hypothetical protein
LRRAGPLPRAGLEKRLILRAFESHHGHEYSMLLPTRKSEEPKKTEMQPRNIRIDDATWKKLVKLAAPENVSILVRRVLRDYIANDKD